MKQLRRWLDAQSKTIAAQQARLDAAAAKLAAEQIRAADIGEKAEREHQIELDAINAMVARLRRV